MLALIGTGGGMLLGELAVGTRTNGLSDEVPSFSSLSANPDAAMPQGEGAPACTDCADSYGAAARLRAQHEERMNYGFREMGAVDVDPLAPVEPVDDGYRYGGRFPDLESRGREDMAKVEDVSRTVPGEEPPPAGEMARSSTER
ncbi:hypothetical protein [Sphingopyxis sp.]|uniref:hypothetical protein n=1 Tax=Sphingopyxis sp. TaxID=1908224 RepID=UPI002ED8380E